MDVTIESLTPERARSRRDGLVLLLQDAVESGASLGFLPPLGAVEAGAYWETVGAALAEESRLLLVACAGAAEVVGSVQLDLALRPNARHRAEVVKLMVLRAARRQGVGRALMVALEAEARRRARTTLILDTRHGDPSERLYQALGYTFVGTIPRFARSADGRLDATAIYYRLLDGVDAP